MNQQKSVKQRQKHCLKFRLSDETHLDWFIDSE